MEIKIERATKANCEAYGTFSCLKDYPCFSGDGWDCWMTEGLASDQPMKLKLCKSEAGIPYQVTKLLKSNGQKLIICPEKPIVVTLAKRGDSLKPFAEDVRALRLEPCEVLLVQPGVWHTICRGTDGAIQYCVLDGGDDSKTVTAELIGEPVDVVM